MSDPAPARLSADGTFTHGATAAGVVLRAAERQPLLVVHGHREGGATAGRACISLECVARVRRAERVARRGRINTVLFCGAGAPGHPSEAHQMAASWRGPAIRMLLDEQSTDTPGNVDEAVRWARSLECRALVVVSSWWHGRLWLYYLRRCPPDIAVHHVRSWRCRRLIRRLANELRYLPRVWFPRDV